MSTAKQQSLGYIPLARKYRPKTFSDLLGQEALVRIIGNSIVRNKIHHAYLLSGVRGTGKTTAARLIAMAINCTKRSADSYQPCLKCNSCELTLLGNHLDVIEFDAASHTGVEDIRDIIENIKYLPNTSKYKIYIIDEVHMLSIQAFNALLKTLEEPPEQVVFIFATTEIRKIPKTILSRCLKFELARLSDKLLTKLIDDVSSAEGITLTDEAKVLLISNAGGSARDCLSLLDLAIAISQLNKINVEDVRAMLGLSDVGLIMSLFSSIITGDLDKAIQLSTELYNKGCDYNLVCQDLLKLTYELVELKIAKEIKVNPAHAELKNLIEKIDITGLLLIWQIINRSLNDLKSTNLIKSSFDLMLVSLIHTKQIINFDDEIESLNGNRPEAKKAAFSEAYDLEDSRAKDINLDNEATMSSDATKSLENESYQESIEVDVNDFENDKSKNENSQNLATYQNLIEFVRSKKNYKLLDGLERYVKVRRYKQGAIEFSLTKFAPKGFVSELRTMMKEVTKRSWLLTQVEESKTDITLDQQKKVEQEEGYKKIENDKKFKNLIGNLPGKVIKVEDKK